MDYNKTIDLVADTLVRAGSTFRAHQTEAYKNAVVCEKSERAKWVMNTIVENAVAAEKNRSPLCDDTGIPHVFIELGPNRALTGETLHAIKEGVSEGLRRLPGRPMAIKGDDNQRLDQSGGLDEDPTALLPAPFAIKEVNEDVLRVHILMLGGGPAIRGITKSVFHKHSLEVIKDEIVSRASEAVKLLGCTPSVLAIGIGRSQYEAASLMLESMVYGRFDRQSDFESSITDKVNESGVGPLGLGGSTSVLCTFAKIGPQRASGVRVVSLRPCCCFEPRIASVEL